MLVPSALAVEKSVIGRGLFLGEEQGREQPSKINSDVFTEVSLVVKKKKNTHPHPLNMVLNTVFHLLSAGLE